MKSWDALETLLGDYLHEDYAYCHGTAWGAVDTFAQEERHYASQLRIEITDILTACQSEPELERAVARLGLNYLPSADGWTSYRAWLLAVADRVDDILRKSPAA
jgi:CdiI immunity protein